jgi:hypothetical protein
MTHVRNATEKLIYPGYFERLTYSLLYAKYIVRIKNIEHAILTS